LNARFHLAPRSSLVSVPLQHLTLRPDLGKGLRDDLEMPYFLRRPSSIGSDPQISGDRLARFQWESEP
jgi:hypothetical protein